jgi:cell wall-associated NlpC family hydrolase
VAQNVSGRHRAPGRFNAIAELKTIAKESAQPAVKGAAVVAASGGLIASFAGTANAADGVSAAAGPAVVGPQVGSLKAANALSAIGYGKPALKTKPLVIEDIKVKRERAEAAADKAAAERRAAAAERASRSTARVALNDAKIPSASGIVGIAQSFFGVPYVYGGSSPSGFDCSGLTSYVYRQAGISIPRTASAQQAAATRVSDPQPGDLVFFGSPAYHVGIYVSPGRMIDAQRPGTVIGNHSIWTRPSGYGRF